jgi:hypothetical protein
MSGRGMLDGNTGHIACPEARTHKAPLRYSSGKLCGTVHPGMAAVKRIVLTEDSLAEESLAFQLRMSGASCSGAICHQGLCG